MPTTCCWRLCCFIHFGGQVQPGSVLMVMKLSCRLSTWKETRTDCFVYTACKHDFDALLITSTTRRAELFIALTFAVSTLSLQRLGFRQDASTFEILWTLSASFEKELLLCLSSFHSTVSRLFSTACQNCGRTNAPVSCLKKCGLERQRAMYVPTLIVLSYSCNWVGKQKWFLFNFHGRLLHVCCKEGHEAPSGCDRWFMWYVFASTMLSAYVVASNCVRSARHPSHQLNEHRRNGLRPFIQFSGFHHSRTLRKTVEWAVELPFLAPFWSPHYFSKKTFCNPLLQKTLALLMVALRIV